MAFFLKIAHSIVLILDKSD